MRLCKGLMILLLLQVEIFMRINLVIGLGSFLISHTLIMMSSPQNEMFLST